MGSVSEILTAVPLHQRPDLLEPCADLINEEWKRSRTSRIHSLQKSTENFPMCLVLIRIPRAAEEATERKLTQSQCQLLGHARLSRVVGQPKSLFVETVVVSKAIRGRGYGRKLMEAVEHYAKSRGYNRLHLTTHDKQHFYAHLGYILSQPVQSVGFMSSLIPMEFLEMISPSQHGKELPTGSRKNNPGASYGSKARANLPSLPPSAPPSSSSSLCSVAPSPPLLHPACSLNSGAVTISPPPQLSASSHTSCFQPVHATVQPSQSPSVPLSANSFSATNIPPPPAPPPPPPAVPPLVAHLPGLPSSCKTAASCPPEDKSQGHMFLETPYHDLKGQPIFWMEKDI
ncbi:N-alpha-acetyltransferase 80 [Eublepharis macularius]|uniref:N-alpha-acetyltransferase 80 n=1 Tax=Eublepharis macularius TaxID=481883 RepID=A0AA97J8F1_EUBMA|nr:N-alpha-acetyltransferase 80 [Eublepharis macularius]XP_054833333.1 N-alpha-acetyltransferase 80 [Eublepharis macularius]